MRQFLILPICLCALALSPAYGEEAGAQTGPDASAAEGSQLLMSKITVSDLPKSYEFYTKIIGMKQATGEGMPTAEPPKAQDPVPEFSETVLSFSGASTDPLLVLIRKRGTTPTPDTAGLTTIGMKVPDVRALTQRIKDAGYTVDREPADTNLGVVIALARDPDGYILELIQAPSSASPQQ